MKIEQENGFPARPVRTALPGGQMAGGLAKARFLFPSFRKASSSALAGFQVLFSEQKYRGFQKS
jgi:hypothetical protein